MFLSVELCGWVKGLVLHMGSRNLFAPWVDLKHKLKKGKGNIVIKI